MKIPRDIMFYALFGVIILLFSIAAHNLYEIQQSIDRSERYLDGYQATPIIIYPEGTETE